MADQGKEQAVCKGRDGERKPPFSKIRGKARLTSAAVSVENSNTARRSGKEIYEGVRKVHME